MIQRKKDRTGRVTIVAIVVTIIDLTAEITVNNIVY
jgi:hypothetical protein